MRKGPGGLGALRGVRAHPGGPGGALRDPRLHAKGTGGARGPSPAVQPYGVVGFWGMRLVILARSFSMVFWTCLDLNILGM